MAYPAFDLSDSHYSVVEMFLIEMSCIQSICILCVLWVITAENPHETALVLPGPPGGLKDLSLFFVCFIFLCLF